MFCFKITSGLYSGKLGEWLSGFLGEALIGIVPIEVHRRGAATCNLSLDHTGGYSFVCPVPLAIFYSGFPYIPIQRKSSSSSDVWLGGCH